MITPKIRNLGKALLPFLILVIAGCSKPDNYEDCVIDGLGEAHTEGAVSLLKRSCSAKFMNLDNVNKVTNYSCVGEHGKMKVALNKKEMTLTVGDFTNDIFKTDDFTYRTKQLEDGNLEYYFKIQASPVNPKLYMTIKERISLLFTCDFE